MGEGEVGGASRRRESEAKLKVKVKVKAEVKRESQRRLRRRLRGERPRSGKVAGRGHRRRASLLWSGSGLPAASSPKGITPVRGCQGNDLGGWLRFRALTPPARRDWLRPPTRREDPMPGV